MDVLQIKTLAAVFSTIFVLTLIGRLFVMHTSCDRVLSVTPFNCFMTGAGLWYLWFLVFVAVLKVSLMLSAGLFLVTGGALFAAMSRAHRLEKQAEHFWSMLVLGLLLLIPAFLWAADDVPLLVEEFSGTLKNAKHILYMDGFPGAAKMQELGMQTLQGPQALLALGVPASLLAHEFLPSAFVLLNVIVVLMAAGALVRITGLPVKWSNLPVVTAGSLLGISLLNPFFSFGEIFSAQANIVISAAFLAVFMPLLAERELPRGWSVCPTALILALLGGLSTAAIVFLPYFWLVWVIKDAMGEQKAGIKALLGWSILLLVPAISLLLWQISGQVGPFEIPVFAASLSFEESMGFLWQHSLSLLLMVAIFYGAIRSFHSLRQAVVEEAWLFVPAGLVLWIVACFAFGWGNREWAAVSVFQFVFLVPLWRWAGQRYARTGLQREVFRAPWVAGLILALMVVVLQYGYQEKIDQKLSREMDTTLRITQSLQKNRLSYGDRIAVIAPQTVPAAHAMTYDLANQAIVLSVPAEVLKYDLNALHETLMLVKAKYILVLRPDEQVSRLFNAGMNEEKSYLFRVQEASFKLEEEYIHLSY